MLYDKKKVSTFCPKQPNSEKKFAFDDKLTKVQESHMKTEQV
jgi:hypothetical protein